MSITELGVKRAMKVLTDAGFMAPKGTNAESLARSWMRAAKELTDEELVEAATEYTGRDHPLYAWPSAGQLVECAKYLRNRAGTRVYTEPEPEGPKATPEEARLAWKAAGYDPDSIRQELGMTRGPRLPKSWGEEAKEVIDRTLPTADRRVVA